LVKWQFTTTNILFMNSIHSKICDVILDPGFDRKRRTPFFYAAPRFWKSHKAADEDEDDLETEEEGKAALCHAFSVCVYCMRLRFQNNYVGWLKSK